MFSLPGRNGRRRRVLNDEVLSASSSHVALRAMADGRESSQAAPRYSDAAGVENHAQVTDFIPRRYRTIALVVLAVSGCASGAQSPPPTASTSPRTRCLVDPNEAGTRPLIFLFCVESP